MAGNQVNCKTSTEPVAITTAPQLSTALTIEPSANKTVKIGDTFTIKATLSPDNVTNKKVNWTSSDSSKATISTNESVSGTSITVTAKKTGTVTITATPADGQAQYAKSITVTINPLTIADISPEYYGDYMDYPVELGLTTAEHTLVDGTIPKTDWRVFYKDDTYTYLIASDYIPTSKFPDGVFTGNDGQYNGYWPTIPNATTPTEKYKSRFLWNSLDNVAKTNYNYKCTSTLLDTDLWKKFVDSKCSDIDSNYAEACIGGPTLEMFCASWNAITPTEPLYFGVNSIGYTYGESANNLNTNPFDVSDYLGYDNTLYFPHKSHSGNWKNSYGYWVSSPAGLRESDDVVAIMCTATIEKHGFHAKVTGNEANMSIRPVVMLKSTLLAEKYDVDGIWEIKGNSLTLDVNEDQVKTPWHSFTVTPTVHNSIENKQVNWYSSNPSVATVSATTTESGTEITIKSIAEGEAIITTALASDNKQTESFKVTVVPPRYEYGDYVDYPVDLGIANNSAHTLVDGTIPKTNWRIFDDDGKYIYLIASDYIPTSKFPAGVFENNDGKYCGWWSSLPLGTTPAWEHKNRFLFNGLSNVDSSYINYKVVSYLLNTELWTSFVNSTYVDACIGGPTLEMMCASWNAETPSQPLYFGVDKTGYKLGNSSNNLNYYLYLVDYEGFKNTLYYPHNKNGVNGGWNGCYGNWISSPSSYGTSDIWGNSGGDGGLLSDVPDYDSNGGLRPVVCLKSTVKLTKDVSGIWQLSN